ncbi:MAG: hypothetical protein KatS3mg102_1393 [Planctomycetota bacterium]|nr:MAG: hypothetical protein KatS3mg102_1393 [Planctomycetota bacterium]
MRSPAPPWIGLVLYAVALALRLGFIAQSQGLPEFRTPTPGLDVQLHWHAARHLRAGTPEPVFELMMPSAPLHPYAVAAFQALLGEDLRLHRIARAALAAISVPLVFWLGLRLGRSRLAAALAALLLAVLPSWIYFDTMVLKVSLEMPLVGALLALLLLGPPPAACSYARAAVRGGAAGLVLALLLLSQGATAGYALVAAGYVLTAGGRSPARRAGGAAAPSGAARVAWLVPMLGLLALSQLAYRQRSALLGCSPRHFLPVGGVHVRVGMQPGAAGTYDSVGGIPPFPYGHTFIARMVAEASAGRPLSWQQADRLHLREAWGLVREQPGEAVRILLRKAALFCNGHELAGNHYLGVLAQDCSVLRLPGTGWAGLLLLGAAGTLVLVRERRWALVWLLGGLVGSVLVANLIGFVTWRYRLHATLPLGLLAVFGLRELGRGAQALLRRGPERRRAARALLAAALLLAPLAWLAFRPVEPRLLAAMTKTALGNRRLSEQAEAIAAELARPAALAADPLHARLVRAGLLHRLARFTEAFQQVRAIAEHHPAEIAASRQYVVYLLWLGEYDQLDAFLRRLRAHHPESLAALLRSLRPGSPLWRGVRQDQQQIVAVLLERIVLPRLGAGP